MSVNTKKKMMAGKMYTEAGTAKGASPIYKQNSKGSNRTPPKYSQIGKDSKFDKSGMMNYTQNGKGTTKGGGMSHEQSGGNEKFEGKYNQ